MKNPKVYLVVSIDGKCVGQILVELFYDVSPRAAEAFLEMCEGHRSEKTPAVTYLKGTIFETIVQGSYVQGGVDSVKRSKPSNGRVSIRGDEGFNYKHDTKGVLSMADVGTNPRISRFLISTSPLPHFDGKHCIFGKVCKGWATLSSVEKVPVGANWRPLREVKIMDCGKAKMPSGNAVQSDSSEELPLISEVLKQEKVGGSNLISSTESLFQEIVDEQGDLMILSLNENKKRVDASNLDRQNEATISQKDSEKWLYCPPIREATGQNKFTVEKQVKTPTRSLSTSSISLSNEKSPSGGRKDTRFRGKSQPLTSQGKPLTSDIKKTQISPKSANSAVKVTPKSNRSLNFLDYSEETPPNLMTKARVLSPQSKGRNSSGKKKGMEKREDGRSLSGNLECTMAWRAQAEAQEAPIAVSNARGLLHEKQKDLFGDWSSENSKGDERSIKKFESEISTTSESSQGKSEKPLEEKCTFSELESKGEKKGQLEEKDIKNSKEDDPDIVISGVERDQGKEETPILIRRGDPLNVQKMESLEASNGNSSGVLRELKGSSENENGSIVAKSQNNGIISANNGHENKFVTEIEEEAAAEESDKVSSSLRKESPSREVRLSREINRFNSRPLGGGRAINHRPIAGRQSSPKDRRFSNLGSGRNANLKNSFLDQDWDKSGSMGGDFGKLSDISTPSTMMSRAIAMKEATDTIVFCSSIVHDLIYTAAFEAEERMRRRGSIVRGSTPRNIGELEQPGCGCSIL